MAFQKELEELPSDMKALIELLIQSRSRINGGIYETVTIWNRLRNYDNYWLNFRFDSEAQFLAHYCLPDGTTLAQWTVMAQLFDRATFVLLGDEVLLYMMRWVGQYQAGADERKKDYEIIFDRYCRAQDDFNKLAFYDVVRKYVIERYEKPLAKQAGMSHVEWLKHRAKQARGKIFRPQVVDASRAQFRSPKVQRDFAWKQDECPYCSTKTQIIQNFIAYTRQLEQLVAKSQSEVALPKKPDNLRSLENLQ
jgi:hypothetical protein